MTETIRKPIAEIKVDRRHRRDLGDLGGLTESIRENGLLQPIGVDLENRLLFGQRRLRACEGLGHTDIETRVFPADVDALAVEFAENEFRKDLTPSERVAIFDTIERKRVGRPSNNRADLPDKAQAAEMAGFSSRRTMSNARQAAKRGIPEVVTAMDSGALSIDAAALVASRPPEEQKKIIELPEKERRVAIRHVEFGEIKTKKEAKEARRAWVATIEVNKPRGAARLLLRRFPVSIVEDLARGLLDAIAERRKSGRLRVVS